MAKNVASRAELQAQEEKAAQTTAEAVKTVVAETIKQTQQRQPDEDEEPLDEGSEELEADGGGSEDQHDDQDDDHDEEEQDDRLGASEEDLGGEGQEGGKRDRRAERKSRRQRRREKQEQQNILIETLQRQVTDLTGEVQRLSSSGQSVTLGQLEQRIMGARTAYQQAEQEMSAAMKKQDGAAFNRALTKRDQARDAYQQGMQYRQQLIQGGQAQQRPTFDPVIMSKAQAFAAKNKWYDPNAKDEDSQIMLALDRALVNEGFDPKTDQYWDELTRRGRRRLPHRFGPVSGQQGQGQRKQQGRKPTGRPGQMGTGSQNSLQDGRGTTLSKERRQALIDAGVKEGTPEWARRVQVYKDWDKKQKEQR